jgi:hypothetical protein
MAVNDVPLRPYLLNALHRSQDRLHPQQTRQEERRTLPGLLRFAPLRSRHDRSALAAPPSLNNTAASLVGVTRSTYLPLLASTYQSGLLVMV